MLLFELFALASLDSSVDLVCQPALIARRKAEENFQKVARLHARHCPEKACDDISFKLLTRDERSKLGSRWDS